MVEQPGVHGAQAAGHVAWVLQTQQRADGLYVLISEMNGMAGFNRTDEIWLKDIAGMSYILAP
jgi:hypothetical protein